MDKQNAETGGADSIDEVALLDIKVFEPKEGAECHQNSKDLVTIVYVFKNLEGDMLLDGNRCHSRYYWEQREPSPELFSLENRHGMEPYEGCYEEDDAKPSDVVECDIEEWNGTKKRIAHYKQKYEKKVLTSIEMLNQYGEERNQEIEDDETGNKIVGEIPERQELFNEVVGGYGLVARDGKNDEDNPIVQIDLKD